MITSLAKAYDVARQVAMIVAGAERMGRFGVTLRAEPGARAVIVGKSRKVGESVVTPGNDSFGIGIAT